MSGGRAKAEVAVAGGRILVRADYSLLGACRALPGRRWIPEEKAWSVPATALHARAVVDQLGSAILDPSPLRGLLIGPAGVECAPLRDPGARHVSLELRGRGAPDGPPVPGERTPSWAHQRAAHWFVRGLWDSGRGGALLAMDMGTGKSKVVVDLVCALGLSPVLILCPKPVLGVWPGQFEAHGWGDRRLLVLRGGRTIAQKAECLLDFVPRAARDGLPCVVVGNYELLSRQHPAFQDAVGRVPWALAVLDEVHRIKKPGGKRSFFLRGFGRGVPRRLGLTGTPLPHSPLDAYAQYRFLDPTIFGLSFSQFRAEFAVPGRFPGQVVAWRNLGRLRDMMGGIMFQSRADEVLDLPEAVHSTVEVELGERAAGAYREMRRALVAWVREGVEVTAANALVKLLRLQQITSGFLTVDDQPSCEVLGREKAEALEELLAEAPAEDKVVVFCRFVADLRSAASAASEAGRRAYELSGRRNEIEEWRSGPPGSVLAAQIQAGKEGVDMSCARRAVYLSQTFSLGDYQQSLARLRRPGQEAQTVFYHHVLARGTVDEEIRAALEAKRDVVESVLSGLRAGERNDGDDERDADPADAGRP